MQQAEWMVRLLMSVDEVTGEAESAAAEAKRNADKQEERLKELLMANQGLQQRVTVLRRELVTGDKGRKGVALGGLADGFDAKKKWGAVKTSMSFSLAAAKAGAKAPSKETIEEKMRKLDDLLKTLGETLDQA